MIIPLLLAIAVGLFVGCMLSELRSLRREIEAMRRSMGGGR